MVQYIARRAMWRANDADGWQERPTCTVLEADDAPQPTGLLDEAGVPLYRVTERVRMGFVK